MKNLSLIVSFVFIVISCSPKQEATQFDMSRAPLSGENMELETEMGEPIQVVFQVEDEGAVDIWVKVVKDPENGELKECTKQGGYMSCMYYPDEGFKGNDAIFVKTVDGDFTGEAKKIEITVNGPADCENLLHGQSETRIKYESTLVAYGGTCMQQEQVRSCNDGVLSDWSGNYRFDNCSVQAPRNCGSVLHLGEETRVMFKTPTVAYGMTCEEEMQKRVCFNGEFGDWSGSFESEACSVRAPLSCGNIPHLGTDTRKMYETPNVAYGMTCKEEDQTRTCENGIFTPWSGNYTAAACKILPPNKCGDIDHNAQDTRVMYQTATVPYGQTCVKETQTRLCTNGNFGDWSGSYQFPACLPEAPKACGNTPHEGIETRVKYENSTVAYGETCKMEQQQRVCTNGELSEWTGTYTHDVCAVGEPAACSNGKAHGESESRVMYETATVAYNQTCAEETQTRICDNGNLSDWSGSFEFASCAPRNPLACGNTPHLGTETRKMYQSTEVAYGGVCLEEDQTRTCTNGIFSDWSGSYMAESCKINDPLACGNTPHLGEETRIMYAATEVEYNQTCQSEEQKRTCTNGQLGNWSGTYTAATCTVKQPLNCGPIMHGAEESRTMYQAGTVAYGEMCVSEEQKRLCTNGNFGDWSGSFEHPACEAMGPIACEGGVAHNEQGSRTMYQTPTVAYGEMCVSEEQNRLCTNGMFGDWSGSFEHEQCAPRDPLACGDTAHGEKETRSMYQSATVAFGQTCVKEDQERLCTNGILGDWSGSYQFPACIPDQPMSCGNIAHEGSETRTMFASDVVPYGQTCQSEEQARVCDNGQFGNWSGSYTHEQCVVSDPMACSNGKVHDEVETRIRYQSEVVAYGTTCVSEIQQRLCNNGVLEQWSGSYTAETCTVAPPPTLDEQIAQCDDAAQAGTIKTTIVTVNFPAAIECEFNENGSGDELNAAGNASRVNGWIRARKEQYTKVNLPSNGRICDMNFTFEEQEMKYDDEVLLLLDNYVLMSSIDYSTNSPVSNYDQVGLKVNELGLTEYKWLGENGLFNLDYASSSKRYCLGVPDNEHRNKCKLPNTDTRGQIKLDIPSSEIIKIGLNKNLGEINEQTEMEFGFVTTGDNDNGDCEHSAYSFEVEIKYVELDSM